MMVNGMLPVDYGRVLEHIRYSIVIHTYLHSWLIICLSVVYDRHTVPGTNNSILHHPARVCLTCSS